MKIDKTRVGLSSERGRSLWRARVDRPELVCQAGNEEGRFQNPERSDDRQDLSWNYQKGETEGRQSNPKGSDDR
jgi:hypothetical protein